MISETQWNNFHITYISDCGFDVLSKFKQLFWNAKNNETTSWKLVGYHDVPHTPGPENTWIVPLGEDGGGVIFKQVIKGKSWSIERGLRGLKQRGRSLIKGIERAREKGFTTPMRIFLFAERYHFGVVQERYMIAELIDGKDLRKTWRNHKKQILQTVIAMHKHQLGWCGDPNPGNFLITPSGEIRAIDLGFNRPSWLEKGKDLYDLNWSLGIHDNKFHLNEFFAKIQCKMKRKGPYGKKGARILKLRLEEDEELEKKDAKPDFLN